MQGYIMYVFNLLIIISTKKKKPTYYQAELAILQSLGFCGIEYYLFESLMMLKTVHLS